MSQRCWQRGATPEESAAALRQLSDGELRRLEQLARLRVIGLHAVDWRDLLHEAVARLLDGSRQWPRDVSLVVFLRETMRSIVSDHWRRLEEPVVMAEADLGVRGVHEETDEGALDNATDPVASPERRASAAETLARIEEVFKGDEDALKVMAGMVIGKTPREIREEAGMNETRYASTQRRIRRGLAREFPGRGC